MFPRSCRISARLLILGALLVFAAPCGFAQSAPASGTAPFVLDGNRMYAELSFVRADGSIHKALAFVDMGSPSTILMASLFKELQLDKNRPLVFRIGEMTVQIPVAETSRENSEGYSVGSDLKVEGLLSAGVLRRYEVVIDYKSRTITLAPPGTIKPGGVPVPFHIKQESGLIAVDVSIDGKPYSVTIDNGSAYTWFRQDAAKTWLSSHPDWQRGVGAVGVSNMRMADDGAEASGILLRVPQIHLGPLVLEQVGVLGAGLGQGFSGSQNFFDWYSAKNAVPVIGWLGGNVLRNFRLTIDYSNHVIYWLKQTDPDLHELDQVGVTLKFERGDYIVAAIATKNGEPTVKGVLPGDRLLRVGHLEMQHATWGAIYSALHGKPGDLRTLTLDRNGSRVTVSVPVAAF